MAHVPAFAQADWPSQPIRFIVGYPPGGGADVTARLFAEHMSRGLGQRIVVENRSGASGAIGATAVAKADPDGYTLLAAAISEITINAAINKSLGYDPVADFAPVSLLGRFPQVLVTAPTFAPNTVAEFIAWAKANPGKARYASFGNNTLNHVNGERFRLAAGIDTVHVPYKGSGQSLIDDLGSELGLRFEDLSAETLARLRPAYPPYSSVHNPVDAWGLGFNAERFGIVLHALLDDPKINFIGFSVDAPGRGGGDVPYALVMAEACVAAKTTKRLAFFNNTSGSGVNAEVRAVLDRADIPYLSGLRPALAAIRNLVQLEPAGDLPAAAALPKLATPLPASEPDCFSLLREHGVPMVDAARAASADAAVALARGFGYPVVLKGIAPKIAHKSDRGLVALGLKDEPAVRAAYTDLADKLARLGATGEVVVQRMAGEGVELILGIRNQPGFGSFVIAGPGGVLVELGNQACVRRGPVSEDEALDMLSRTAAGRLLDGVRGRAACDKKAAARAIAAFSRIGAALADTHAALEINPLVVTPGGAVGVDFLHEPYASER